MQYIKVRIMRVIENNGIYLQLCNCKLILIAYPCDMYIFMNTIRMQVICVFPTFNEPFTSSRQERQNTYRQLPSQKEIWLPHSKQY